jgi:hypothetical protein
VYWNCKLGLEKLSHWPGPHYTDPVTAFERRFDDIRAAVRAYQIVDHYLEMPANPTSEILAKNGWRSHLAQYSLTPVVVDLYKNPHPATVVNSYDGPARLLVPRP